MFLLWLKLLKLLEAIGRIRLPLSWKKQVVAVGDPDAPDAMGGAGWQEYRSGEKLFDVWGPVPGSAWDSFHCATLFAALDYAAHPLRIGPAAVSTHLTPESPPPAWAADDVWAIVDLPGPVSVATAAWLCASAGFQPVCTFDNWPNPAGLVHPERTLAALLRYATLMEQARRPLRPESPPLWICDRDRLGSRPGRPKEFDNRYFLDDSLLPGPELLKAAGIRQVVYFVLERNQPELADLSSYFAMLQTQGFTLLRAALEDEESLLRRPEPFEPQRRQFRATGFFRSTAGGFGAPIPEPSSSSG
jgi:hypothetical protein